MSIYKADMEDAKKNWISFWNGKNTRPMVSSVILRKGAKPVAKPPYASGYDGNFSPVLDQLEQWLEAHEFLGEAIPYYYLEFAADHFTALCGADLTFPGEGGGWPVHFVDDWKNADLSFRREGKWWQRTVDFAEAIKSRFGDNIMIAAPTLCANLDALVAARGATKLALDLVEQPDMVHKMLVQVCESYREILDEIAILLEYNRLGSITRHGMYSRGYTSVMQCDFSCMISGKMFREFVLPCFKFEAECLDDIEYHLDGKDAIRHLEDICSIEKLGVIQWEPGAGNEKTDWTWLYDKIDTLGKGQWFHMNYGVDWNSAVDIIRKYKSKRLFFTLSVQSKQEFDDNIGLLESVWKNRA